MDAYVEVWSRRGPELVAVGGTRTSLGRGHGNDIRLPDDPNVSDLHAVIERYGAGWTVRDLGSANGTFVNAERVDAERRLRHGDELILGRTRLVFRLRDTPAVTATAAPEPPPRLSRRERDVLIALCRPLADGDMFTEPATVSDMAADLVVSEPAIKFHLGNLYNKFGLTEPGDNRRYRLANEAIRRGAVTVSELRRHRDP